jgi:hypothetical protein
MCTGDSYVCWGQLCVLGTATCIKDSYVYSGQLCVFRTATCIKDSYVYSGQLLVLRTATCIQDSYVYQIGGLCYFIRESYVRSVSRYCFTRNYAAIPVQLEVVVLQYISWCVLLVCTFVFNQFSCFCQFIIIIIIYLFIFIRTFYRI